MDLVYNSYIFPVHDICMNGDISSLHINNQILYGDLLSKLQKGKTWYGLNYDWPNNCSHPIPEDADTYVFSWHLENWDNHWLDQFCEKHPTQQVVVIGEFKEVPRHKNLRILVYHCWAIYASYLLRTFGNEYKFSKDRVYRLSSLCNKPSFLKALVSAYLLEHYYPRSDLLLSWNKNVQKEHCRSMDFLNESAFSDRLMLTRAIKFYHQSDMINQQISIDEFINVPHDHCDFTHNAFAQSLINLTNETFAQNQMLSRKLPGPYLSEKTWKVMLAGTGLLPVSQSGVYDYMENFGFRMDYPWPKEFDSTVGDLDRIQQVFKTIDWILSDSCLDNKSQIIETNQFNFEHIRSQCFLDTINMKNQQELEIFLQGY